MLASHEFDLAIAFRRGCPRITSQEKGVVTNALEQIEGLELIVNAKYATCVDELRVHARNTTHDTNNPFFRILQILEHLRR